MFFKFLSFCSFQTNIPISQKGRNNRHKAGRRKVVARAYVLVETALGQTPSVVEALRQISGVKSVDPITGPYDAVVVVEGESNRQVGITAMVDIQRTVGVTRIMTCYVFE